MIIKEPNLFTFTQLKNGTLRVDTPLTDSIGDEIVFYVCKTKKSGYDYVITDDGYSFDSPVLYADKAILKALLKKHDPKLVFDKTDDIKEYATSQQLNSRMIDYLHTLIFAQGIDYLLNHLSGKSNGYLSPVVVARKLDGLKNAVKRKHLSDKQLPGLIDGLKHSLSI